MPLIMFGVLWIAETQLHIHARTHTFEMKIHTLNWTERCIWWEMEAKRASSHANANSCCLAFFVYIDGICFITISLRCLAKILVSFAAVIANIDRIETVCNFRSITGNSFMDLDTFLIPNFSFYSLASLVRFTSEPYAYEAVECQQEK